MRCYSSYPAILLLAIALIAHAGTDVEQNLREHYQRKVFLLRSFCQGDRLHFDSAGTSSQCARSGDWTINGFVLVKGIHLSPRRVSIKGNRLLLRFDGNEFQSQHGDKFQINAEVDANHPSQADVDAALSKIFLTSQDDLSEIVPDYWKPCVKVGRSGKQGCQLSPELASVPGVPRPANAQTGPDESVNTSAANRELFKVGKGVTPPRVLHQSDIQYSELARKARYQGTVTLGLTVDATGTPQNLHIVSPLGLGLDSKAIESVQKWRFEPAKKNGEPVAVEIGVEVAFHLY
jgi:TonB family protein